MLVFVWRRESVPVKFVSDEMFCLAQKLYWGC
jgi:hypothetical protein